jgi:peptide/nickel transport system ATP-binding protein
VASPAGTAQPLLRIADLQVAYTLGRTRNLALQGVSFDVGPGEKVAVVGESGSGKSTTAHAVMRLLPSGGAVTAGSITLNGRELTTLRERQMRAIRGGQLGLIPQDPMSSLNPLTRIGKQLKETLKIHGRMVADGEEQVIRLLEQAGLPAERVKEQYPHQLSGGMRQRVLIASALACLPSLVIADEPTSALDVTVQRQILDRIDRISAETGASVLFITHDLAVAGDRADRIVVMKGGRVVETGTVDEILGNPSEEYTRRLLASAPSLSSTILFAAAPKNPRPERVISVKGLRKVFTSHGEEHVAVADSSFEINRGETLAIVGESGSGKSTTARLLLRLERADTGTIMLNGTDISRLRGDRLRPHRREMQMVYQNPFGSLSPRLKVGEIVAEPLRIHGLANSVKRSQLARDLLEQVSLDPALAERRAAQLSGGQRQRVAVARALALEPSLIVCDEPVSALDVTVQAQILELLARIQRERKVAYLFISHDLSVVRQIAHRVLVMNKGQVVEAGVTADVFASPRAEYTRTLLSAIPGRERTPAVQDDMKGTRT